MPSIITITCWFLAIFAIVVGREHDLTILIIFGVIVMIGCVCSYILDLRTQANDRHFNHDNDSDADLYVKDLNEFLQVWELKQQEYRANKSYNDMLEDRERIKREHKRY